MLNPGSRGTGCVVCKAHGTAVAVLYRGLGEWDFLDAAIRFGLGKQGV